MKLLPRLTKTSLYKKEVFPLSKKPVDFIENKFQSEQDLPLFALFSQEARERAARTHQKLGDAYNETPLVSLNDFAALRGINQFCVKDESQRGSLNAFKLLGGTYAVINLLCEMTNTNIDDFELDSLTASVKKMHPNKITFATASDGNHGRSIAFSAKITDQKAIIYMPKGTAQDRIDNIEALGAKVVVTKGNYDDCGRMISEDAEKNGWIIVPDTATEGDPKVAQSVMMGYLTMADEMIRSLSTPPTHMFLQAGVGSMASTMMCAFKQFYGKDAPKVYIVEPHQSDCFFRSAKAGESVTVTGDLDSIMAGLSCGVPSPDAWPLIKNYAAGFFSVSDFISANGMRILANPTGKDTRIISGESGAVGTGLVDYILTQAPEIKEAVQLNEKSRVLVISTEGATDRKTYRDVVWYGKFSQY